MNEVATIQPRETLPAMSMTPMEMVSYAVHQNQDLERIRELMQLEREWKADRAREAFYEAMAEFKKVPVAVIKDKENTQYKSKYATLGNMVATVNAAMAPFGLNARWDIKQGDRITVTCILSHTLGHSERVEMSGTPDTSGSKNPLQQIKSTVTYLESATFQAITGVVSQDEKDDDGNGAGVVTISEEQKANLECLITEAGVDEAKFLRWAKVDSLAEMPEKSYSTAIRHLEAARKRAQ